MSATAMHELPTEQLGGWRFTSRGELRALPGLLRHGEHVLGMAIGSVGNWKGRLFVATDSRLLLVSKSPLRRARCTELSYEQVHLLHAAAKGGGWEVRVNVRGEQQTWQLLLGDRGERFVRLVAARTRAEESAIEGGAENPCAAAPGAPLRLLLTVAGLAVVVLYVTDVLARDPALAAFVGLALALAVAEWRADVPVLQVAFGIAVALSVAVFVFEVLPFGLGAVVALAAIVASLAVRQPKPAA